MADTVHEIKLPKKLARIFEGKARYRGAHGGRGSGKTRGFALMAAVAGAGWASAGKTGVILCAREFQNSLRDSSYAEITAAIRSDSWLSTQWEIGAEYIRSVRKDQNGRSLVEFVFRGLRHNKESLKGIARIRLVWCDEAETISEESWATLIPTVREEGSEIWVTWNPASERAATNQRFIVNATPDMKIIQMNWRDNPWFPTVLDEERLRDLEARPEDYNHVWEGAYKTAWKGAYFTRQLAEARQKGRIGIYDRHPNMSIRTYWDLGRKDHTAIWITQFIDGNIRVIDFIEGAGQSPGFYFEELRKRGYEGCHVGLPHDGAHVPPSSPDGMSYEDQARRAGFKPEIVKSGMASAAQKRVDAARRVFPSIFFDEENCAAGIKALEAYREKWDEDRQVGLGPLHDWSSHAADAFGLMCVDYEEPKNYAPVDYSQFRSYTGSW